MQYINLRFRSNSAATFILAFAVVIIFNSTVLLANISYAQLFQPLPPSLSPSVQSLAPSKNAGPQLTPEQKAAMCKPDDSSVNTTESHVCGIPPTSPSSLSSSPTGANATTRAEAPRSSSAAAAAATPTSP